MKKVMDSAKCRTLARVVSVASAAFLIAQISTQVWGSGLAFAAASPSSAISNDQTNNQIRAGLQAGFEAYHQNRRDLAKGYLHRVAKRSLDILIAQGCDQLRQVGEVQLATQLQTEWSHQIAPAVNTEISILELGDFDPISPWLENFYNTLYYKTRGMVKGIRVLHDIYLMNYSLAVVFRPNGEWRTRSGYDRIEYRKHFIPFADTATYWITVQACKKYVPKFKTFCQNGANVLEKMMGMYVAPVLSDQIFALATRTGANGHQLTLVEPAFTEIDFAGFENQSMSIKEEE